MRHGYAVTGVRGVPVCGVCQRALRRDPERLVGDDAALRALAERYGLKMVSDGPTIDGAGSP
jgi:hypothetical protein